AQHSRPDRAGLGPVRDAELRPVASTVVPAGHGQLRERDLLRHEPERVRAQGIWRGLGREPVVRRRHGCGWAARRHHTLMFKKVLIANRGEIALRVIRACKELGIATVAVYSEADRECLHVRFADDDVCIGRPPGRDSYLNIPRIIAAAEITGADAIHPGYGFLAENAEFADIVKASNITFIGPTPDQIRQMGDKAEARKIAQQVKIPTVPGSPGPVESMDEGLGFAEKIGFPVIIKAAAGGGGKGMRVANDRDQFTQSYNLARQEALAACGSDQVYIEKYLARPRHVEIQIMGDEHGRIMHLCERDCSIQRRHQKLVEEAPSPALNQALRE